MARNRITEEMKHEILKFKKITKSNGKIESDKTIDTLIGSSTRIGEWLMTQKDDRGKPVRRLNQVNRPMFESFIKDMSVNGGRYGKGASKKTLKAYITVMNKVLISKGLLDEQKRFELRQILPNHHTSRVYKREDSDTWQKNNLHKAELYKDSIDIARAFGLRKSEIFGSSGVMRNRGWNGVTASSFVIAVPNQADIERAERYGSPVPTPTLYVQTIGKGGKYRLARCSDAYMSEMIARYGQMAQKTTYKAINQINDRMISKDLNSLKNAFIRRNKAEKPLITGVDSSMSYHIFRAEYAQTRLREEIGKAENRYKMFNQNQNLYKKSDKIGYSKVGTKGNSVVKYYIDHNQEVGHKYQSKSVDVNNQWCVIRGRNEIYRGYVSAFMSVSLAMGHNRLDVMRTYL